MSTLHHKVVIVGGGAAGASVAARLLRHRPKLDVAIVEPSEKHYYQPMWTLVGGGVVDRESTVRPQKEVLPRAASWIHDRVTRFDPDHNAIQLASNRKLEYEFLVVAPGIQLNWNAIPGLAETLGRDGVCSNYSFDSVPKTWEFIRALERGKAIFTHPNTPIKCGGAPQKIMYLAADYFRKQHRLEEIDITFGIATPKIFGASHYVKPLEQVADRYGIDVRYQYDLAKIRSNEREAVFNDLANDREVVLPYDLLHVTPPMSAPDFVKESPLAGEGGWISVDKNTCQHTRFENVFSLGDASNLPTSKTAAAIRKQAPVAAENLLSLIDGKPLSASYDGYTSCPLVTGYGKLILAEFDYDGNPQETFPFDQSKERWTMYQLKKRVLPKLYWHGMLKGRA